MQRYKIEVVLFIPALTVFLFACFPSRNIQTKLPANSYSPVDSALYKLITEQDSLLFETFNTQNLKKLIPFFGENLEVYQDNIGVRNYEQTIESFKGLFKMPYVLKRAILKESVEVYPVKNYGAIQTGRHTFCHVENGKLECETYKFVIIWENKNSQWKITKLITYDHKL